MRTGLLELTEKLLKLDLSTYPDEEVEGIIRKLGRFGVLEYALFSDEVIMRARPNSEKETFFSKCQLTYKPKQFNKTYQRASTPKMTMFYGSVFPKKIEEGELKDRRITTAFETVEELRNKECKHYQKITFGNWVLKKPIKVAAILQHENFYSQSSFTRELVDSFKKFAKEELESEEETIFISNFIANQFAIEDIEYDYQYLISAIFTELFIKQGFDGVLYPSTRVGGQGFNIAIKPEIADNSLELISAGECTIYKNGIKVLIDNDSDTTISPNQTHFELVPITDSRYHAGEQESLKRIGVSSINELKRNY